MENLKNIQAANLVTALKLGLIDWFTFFTEWKKLDIKEDK